MPRVLQQIINGTTQKSEALPANPCFGRPAQSSRSPGRRCEVIIAVASPGMIALTFTIPSASGSEKLKTYVCDKIETE